MRRRKFTKDEKLIAAKLAKDDVDEKEAAELIEQAKKEIQESWTKQDELEHRAGPTAKRIEFEFPFFTRR